MSHCEEHRFEAISRGFDSWFQKCCKDPFRVFFPLGTLGSLVGVGFWIPLTLSDSPITVSTKFHVWMQVYGFIWPFILGFLTTAVPRLTGTSYCKPLELLSLFGLWLFQVSALFKEAYVFAHGLFLIEGALLLLILGRRFVRNTRPIPVTFLYLPLAFLCALSGAGSHLGLTLGVLKPVLPWYHLARILLFQGFILFLLLGVGGFLVRSILGWGEALPGSRQGVPVMSPGNPTLVAIHGILGLLICISFPVEVWMHGMGGALLRAGGVSCIALWWLKLYRIPSSGKLGSIWLWLAFWLLLAGLWGSALVPDYDLAWAHLCYIGGFALSLFSIATRVIWSHTGRGQLCDHSHKLFSSAMILMVLGLMTRFLTDTYDLGFRHYGYAGLLWCVGLVLWVICVSQRPQVGNAVR